MSDIGGQFRGKRQKAKADEEDPARRSGPTSVYLSKGRWRATRMAALELGVSASALAEALLETYDNLPADERAKVNDRAIAISAMRAENRVE